MANFLLSAIGGSLKGDLASDIGGGATNDLMSKMLGTPAPQAAPVDPNNPGNVPQAEPKKSGKSGLMGHLFGGN